MGRYNSVSNLLQVAAARLLFVFPYCLATPALDQDLAAVSAALAPMEQTGAALDNALFCPFWMRKNEGKLIVMWLLVYLVNYWINTNIWGPVKHAGSNACRIFSRFCVLQANMGNAASGSGVQAKLLLWPFAKLQITAHALHDPAIQNEQPALCCQVLTNTFSVSGAAPGSFRHLMHATLHTFTWEIM